MEEENIVIYYNLKLQTILYPIKKSFSKLEKTLIFAYISHADTFFVETETYELDSYSLIIQNVSILS
jgi:hypothetical protein